MANQTKPNLPDEFDQIPAPAPALSFGQNNVIQIGRDVIGTLYGYSPDQVAAIVSALRESDHVQTYTGTPPYPGLVAYQERDAELFFGRERLTSDLAGRINSSRFLCLAGPSGSGKSSVVRAGLLPALRSGQIVPGSEKWLIETFTPGQDPLQSLTQAISAMALQAGKDFRAVGTYLSENIHQDAASLSYVIGLLTQGDETSRAVLVIDQFEQVFSRDSDSQKAFISQLIHAAQEEAGRLIIILTLRSDFLGSCVGYPPLMNMINQGFQLIGALQADELARAITLPALKVGVDVEPELAQQVIADMRGEPGALPLMQFALKDLFEEQKPAKGESICLTRQEYLERGGVWQALCRHADSSLARLGPAEQEIARTIFTRLMNVSQNQAVTRRVATFEELEDVLKDSHGLELVLDRLTEARLIIVAGDQEADKVGSDQRFYTLAHERLIEAWPWLNRLMEENRQAIALSNQIEADARQWEDNKHDASYLYGGAKLSAIAFHQGDLQLSQRGRDFLRESRDHEAEAIRQSYFNELRSAALRGMAGGAAGFGLAYLILTWNQVAPLGGYLALVLLMSIIIWGFIGGLAGLITSVGLLHARAQGGDGRRPEIRKYVLGGMYGAVAFSLAFLAFALQSNQANEPIISKILEGALWGLVTGLTLTWSASSARPFWFKLGAAGFIGGAVLVVGENFGKAYQRPDPYMIAGWWQAFLAGALVPICFLVALSLKKSSD